ncbi:MAG: DNA mismatch repair protein MutS [Thermodesulfovibrionales bacterium]|nr:DNA mismatch repair protein MutS [Thermodesulfovibrionales bacterium]
MSDNTPLMKQYSSIKERYPDCIVFFRLGDFYEMFDEDAKIASSILQITLTSRDKNKDEPIAMCGVPHFSADIYISKLIKAGYKVAICEQVEDPKSAKGIVKREVVKVITPGTYSSDEPTENTYIMGLFLKDETYGVALADLSTGDFILFETNNDIQDEVSRYEPKELLIPESLKDIILDAQFEGIFKTYYEDWLFDYPDAYKRMLNHFNVSTLEGYGCDNLHAAICAGGALLHYLTENLNSLTFKGIKVIRTNEYMYIDNTTKRNLEITQNLKDGTMKGSLLWILDHTQTPMGARLLRSAITKPLMSLVEIKKRQNAVKTLIEDYALLEELRTTLRNINDIQRLASKIINESISPKEIIVLKSSVSYLPKIKRALVRSENSYIKEIGVEISELQDLRDIIQNAIVDAPSNTVGEGGVIRTGYNKEIDELRIISSDAKGYIANLEQEERIKTGISSLKIGYNKVFGYYIEVTNPNLQFVPPDYIRKQTLTNCERFITPDLKDYEAKVLNAEQRLKELETEEYRRLVISIKRFTEDLFKTSDAVGMIDFLLSLATVAKRNDYTMPTVDDSDTIEIQEGRHPIVEKLIKDRTIAVDSNAFIPNDCLLDKKDNMILIITGPNMAGKSTYMRQVALISLMAQIGSYVPATKARIGLIDRIFTRIGASDFITRGQSTFMVEMLETANILNNATDRSLILLDEIGRGTSTFDGISIAWAVVEYLAQVIKARTLFATHYHELTDLEFRIDNVKNYNVLVREWGDSIIFLHRVEKGSADKSYGIQVGRLAGIPEKVVARAKEILSRLEKKEAEITTKRSVQLSLFGDASIEDEILNLDLQNMTPQKALKKLKELQARLMR